MEMVMNINCWTLFTFSFSQSFVYGILIWLLAKTAYILSDWWECVSMNKKSFASSPKFKWSFLFSLSLSHSHDIILEYFKVWRCLAKREKNKNLWILKNQKEMHTLMRRKQSFVMQINHHVRKKLSSLRSEEQANESKARLI